MRILFLILLSLNVNAQTAFFVPKFNLRNIDTIADLKVWFSDQAPPPLFVPTEAAFLAAIPSPGSMHDTAAFANSTSSITYTHLSIDDFVASDDDGNSIRINNAHDITIQYCIIKGTPHRGIMLNNCYNVTITKCLFIDSVRTGIYALNCDSNIVINQCLFRNMIGGDNTKGCSTQFNGCSGPGNELTGNYTVNDRDYYDSPTNSPPDIHNFFNTSGTAGSRFLVQYNYVFNPSQHGSGCGLLFEDSGEYLDAWDNVLIQVSQCGVGAFANHLRIRRNIIQCPQLSNSNIGLACYDIDETGCDDIEITDNKINYINSSGSQNAFYFGGTPCTNVTTSGNTEADGSVTDTWSPPTLSLWWVSEEGTGTYIFKRVY